MKKNEVKYKPKTAWPALLHASHPAELKRLVVTGQSLYSVAALTPLEVPCKPK